MTHDSIEKQLNLIRKLTKGVLFHNNAPLHKSVTAMAAIHGCGFKLIENLPYFPDLAPSNFNLYPKLDCCLDILSSISNKSMTLLYVGKIASYLYTLYY